jgi:hypothetical protein
MFDGQLGTIVEPGCDATSAALGDPLVAALLGDDPELCCAYVHDAICSSSGSGDWWEDEDTVFADAAAAACAAGLAAAQGADALDALRERALGAVSDALTRSDVLGAQHPDPAHPELLRLDRELAAATRASHGAAASSACHSVGVTQHARAR